MRYLGSKRRLCKYIIPVIQKYIDDTGYDSFYDVFVGGANVIDKVKCKNKYGFDNNKYLIALLNHTKETGLSDIPEAMTEEEYKLVKNNKDNYPDWYVGLVGFCASFSAKFFNGYARNGTKESYRKPVYTEATNNLKKQSSNLLDCIFEYHDFRDINPEEFHNSVIYLDPPYRGTTKYATGEFPYDEFYNWCKRIPEENVVLLSEYEAPDIFDKILEVNIKATVDSKRNSNDYNMNRVEKLFILKN